MPAPSPINGTSACVNSAARHKRRVIFRPAFGAPTVVADQLHEAMAAARTTHLALGVLPGMDPALTSASLQRIAEQVAPALSHARTDDGPSDVDR